MEVERRTSGALGGYDWSPIPVEKVESLVQAAMQIETRIIETRRHFHRLAELGWLEFRTTAEIVRELRTQGFVVFCGRDFINPKDMIGAPQSHGQVPRPRGEKGPTGCMAFAKAPRPGPTVALRFDIDALPIEEADAPHRPSFEGWRSEDSRVMHACGHDAHIAIGLAVAQILAPHIGRGRGSLKLIFQPAEEGARGAIPVVLSGHLDDVDLFLSCHVGMGLPTGSVAAKVSGFQATRKFLATLQGRSAHAGKEPQNGRNALLAAATAALNLHTLNQHSEADVRINVGLLEAGRVPNIVPEFARMAFEIRAGSRKTLESLAERSLAVLRGAAESFGVEVETKVVGEAVGATSDLFVAEEAEKLCRAGKLFDFYVREFSFNAAEDATIMMKAVQENGGASAYIVFGSDLAGAHHTALFDIDESVLARSASMLSLLVCSAMDLLRDD